MSIDRRSFLGLLSSMTVPVTLGSTEYADATQLVTGKKHSSDTWGFAIEGPTSVIGMVVGCDRWPNQAACLVAQKQVEERGREIFSSGFRTLDLQNLSPLEAPDWVLIAANGDDGQNLEEARRVANRYRASGATAVVFSMRDQEAVWLASSIKNDPTQGEALLELHTLLTGQGNAPATFEVLTLDPLFDLLRMCELLARSNEGLFGVDPDLEKSLMSPTRQGLTAEAGAGGAHRAYVATDFVVDDIARMAGTRWLDQQLDMVVWVRLGMGGSPLREIRSVIERLRARVAELGNLRDVSFAHVQSDDDPFLTVRVLMAPITPYSQAPANSKGSSWNRSSRKRNLPDCKHFGRYFQILPS